MDSEAFNNDWHVRLNNMTKEFNKKREEFVNEANTYFRQSPYSDYVTEQKLIAKLQELDDIRTKLKKLSKDHYPNTNSSLYKKEFRGFYEYN